MLAGVATSHGFPLIGSTMVVSPQVVAIAGKAAKASATTATKSLANANHPIQEELVHALAWNLKKLMENADLIFLIDAGFIALFFLLCFFCPCCFVLTIPVRRGKWVGTDPAGAAHKDVRRFRRRRRRLTIVPARLRTRRLYRRARRRVCFFGYLTSHSAVEKRFFAQAKKVTRAKPAFGTFPRKPGKNSYSLPRVLTAVVGSKRTSLPTDCKEPLPLLSNAMIELLYPGIRTHFVASRGQLSEPHHVLLGFQVPTSASGYLAAVKPSL